MTNVSEDFDYGQLRLTRRYSLYTILDFIPTSEIAFLHLTSVLVVP